MPAIMSLFTMFVMLFNFMFVSPQQAMGGVEWSKGSYDTKSFPFSFSDDFTGDDGALSAEWSTVFGTISRTSGVVYGAGSTTNGSIVLSSSGVKDGTIICSINRGNSSYCRVGIIFRYKDSSNYYKAYIDDRVPDVVRFRYMIAGSSTDVDAAFTINGDTWYTMAVTFVGDSIKVDMGNNGSYEIDTTVAGLDSGSVGVFLLNESVTAVGKVDNFSIVGTTS